MVTQALLHNMLNHWQEQATCHQVTLSSDRLALLNVLNWGLRTPPCWQPTYQLIEQISPLFEQSGPWDDWYNILYQTQQVARLTTDTPKTVNVTILLARLAQRQGNLASAVHYYKQAIGLAHDEEVSKARACSNLGYIYAEQGRFWRAEALCCYALEVFERQQLLDKLAHTHNHLGVLYTRQEKFEAALFHLTQARQLWLEIPFQLLSVNINLGLLSITQGDNQNALRYLKEALHLAHTFNNPLQIATIRVSIGYQYYLDNRFPEALEELEQAATTFQRVVYQEGLARTWHIFGLIYAVQGFHDRAKDHFKLSLNLYQELDHPRGMAQVQESLDNLPK